MVQGSKEGCTAGEKVPLIDYQVTSSAGRWSTRLR